MPAKSENPIPENVNNSEDSEHSEVVKTVVDDSDVVLHVSVRNVTPKRRLHPDDLAVAGLYEAVMPAGMSASDCVTATLDAFHESNGIKVLDDFEIVVFDPETHQILVENDNPLVDIEAQAEVYAIEGIPLRSYDVTVRCEGPDGEIAGVLGQGLFVGRNLSEVYAAAHKVFWEPRLESSGCRSRCTASRLG